MADVHRNAKKQSGIEFLVGFESEFVLLKSTSPPMPVNDYGYSVNHALATGTVETIVLEEIVDSLIRSGVQVQAYHSEGAPGQFEIITGPLVPIAAADALLHTRETIYNVATKHGLRATFAPRVFPTSCTFCNVRPRAQWNAWLT